LEKKVIEYIVKENGIIKLKSFEIVDGIVEGLTSDMFLTRDEIVYDIITNRLSSDDKAHLKAASGQTIIGEHLGLGMWIRNSYGLWENLTNPLVEENPEPDDIKHPDNCSFEIMELVVQTLNGEYTPDVKFTNEDFDNAMNILGEV